MDVKARLEEIKAKTCGDLSCDQCTEERDWLAQQVEVLMAYVEAAEKVGMEWHSEEDKQRLWKVRRALRLKAPPGKEDREAGRGKEGR